MARRLLVFILVVQTLTQYTNSQNNTQMLFKKFLQSSGGNVGGIDRLMNRISAKKLSGLPVMFSMFERFMQWVSSNPAAIQTFPRKPFHTSSVSSSLTNAGQRTTNQNTQTSNTKEIKFRGGSVGFVSVPKPPPNNQYPPNSLTAAMQAQAPGQTSGDQSPQRSNNPSMSPSQPNQSNFLPGYNANMPNKMNAPMPGTNNIFAQSKFSPYNTPTNPSANAKGAINGQNQKSGTSNMHMQQNGFPPENNVVPSGNNPHFFVGPRHPNTQTTGTANGQHLNVPTGNNIKPWNGNNNVINGRMTARRNPNTPAMVNSKQAPNKQGLYPGADIRFSNNNGKSFRANMPQTVGHNGNQVLNAAQFTKNTPQQQDTTGFVQSSPQTQGNFPRVRSAPPSNGPTKTNKIHQGQFRTGNNIPQNNGANLKQWNNPPGNQMPRETGPPNFGDSSRKGSNPAQQLGQGNKMNKQNSNGWYELPYIPPSNQIPNSNGQPQFGVVKSKFNNPNIQPPSIQHGQQIPRQGPQNSGSRSQSWNNIPGGSNNRQQSFGSVPGFIPPQGKSLGFHGNQVNPQNFRPPSNNNSPYPGKSFPTSNNQMPSNNNGQAPRQKTTQVIGPNSQTMTSQLQTTETQATFQKATEVNNQQQVGRAVHGPPSKFPGSPMNENLALQTGNKKANLTKQFRNFPMPNGISSQVGINPTVNPTVTSQGRSFPLRNGNNPMIPNFRNNQFRQNPNLNKNPSNNGYNNKRQGVPQNNGTPVGPVNNQYNGWNNGPKNAHNRNFPNSKGTGNNKQNQFTVNNNNQWNSIKNPAMQNSNSNQNFQGFSRQKANGGTMRFGSQLKPTITQVNSLVKEVSSKLMQFVKRQNNSLGNGNLGQINFKSIIKGALQNASIASRNGNSIYPPTGNPQQMQRKLGAPPVGPGTTPNQNKPINQGGTKPLPATKSSHPNSTSHQMDRVLAVIKSNIPPMEYTVTHPNGQTWLEITESYGKTIRRIRNDVASTEVYVDTNPSLKRGRGLFVLVNSRNCWIGVNNQNTDFILGIANILKQAQQKRPKIEANPWTINAVEKERIPEAVLRMLSPTLLEHCEGKLIHYIRPTSAQVDTIPDPNCDPFCCGQPHCCSCQQSMPYTNCIRIAAANYCVSPDITTPVFPTTQPPLPA